MKKNPFMLVILTIMLTGCGMSENFENDPDKEEIAEGKADGFDVCGWYSLDIGCDLCAEFDWYGDGECDQNLIDVGVCAGPDSDCGFDVSPFVSFSVFRSSGPPMTDLDLSGFIELRADGTLLVDRVGELPVVVHEAVVSHADLERAISIVTNSDLLSLLQPSDPPCVQPADYSESMMLTMEGETYGNWVALCDQPSIEAARAIMNELADLYLPVEEPEFVSFRVARSRGPLVPETDLSGFIELRADGTLLVDRVDELPAIVHEAVVDNADLERAISIVTDSQLVSLLRASEPPCNQTQGASESMIITFDDETYNNLVTFCDQPSIEAARAIMDELAAIYVPVEESQLESFRISWSSGPPDPERDLYGYIELRSDGTLLVDRVGELPEVVYEAVVDEGYLRRVNLIVTDADFVTLLQASEPPCVQPLDYSESMTLKIVTGESYRNLVAFCDQDVIEAARAIMNEIAWQYLPPEE